MRKDEWIWTPKDQVNRFRETRDVWDCEYELHVLDAETRQPFLMSCTHKAMRTTTTKRLFVSQQTRTVWRSGDSVPQRYEQRIHVQEYFADRYCELHAEMLALADMK